MGIYDKQAASRQGVSQAVAYTGTSATCTNPFGSQTYQIRISSTTACHFRVVEAAGGAAVAADSLLPINWVEYINVSPGQKISAIQDTAGGTLSVTEMS
jgi:hypothetical protein